MILMLFSCTMRPGPKNVQENVLDWPFAGGTQEARLEAEGD
jgi:hypothetical protein